MIEKPTIEQLRQIRDGMRKEAGSVLDHAAIGILLDDLIERREAGDPPFICPGCRMGDHAGPQTVGHGWNGRKCMCGCDAPQTATARDLLTDPTGDEI